MGGAVQGDPPAGAARRAVPAEAPTGGLSAVQYLRGEETVVLAWLQAQHYGEPVPAVRLRGLDPTASYECRETGEVHRGAVLLHHGLRTELRGDLDATVLRLHRI
ncbi:GH36 C-terminal domain-containing protein [Streptomyces nogalater]